jgi:nucleotide-binding universal stress UspA family protein
MANVIILPIDFSNLSEAALPLAKRIASVLDAQIHCVYVVEQPHIYTAVDMATPVVIPAPEDIADSARAQLEKFIASHLPNTQTGAIAKVLVGRPAEEILDYADETDAEMIIMTTHGYGGVKHMLLGSTTEAVLRNANCPVLSVRSQ